MASNSKEIDEIIEPLLVHVLPPPLAIPSAYGARRHSEAEKKTVERRGEEAKRTKPKAHTYN